jgi:competence protein ComEC
MSQGQPLAPERAPAGFFPWLRAQRPRYALWAPVALGCGTLGYFLLTVEPPAWAGWTAAALALLAFLLAPRLVQGSPVAATTGLVALGFALAVLRADLVATPVLERTTAALTVTGRVVDAFGHRDGRPRILLAVESAPGLPAVQTPRILRLALRKVDPLPRPGTRLTLRVRLTPLTLPVTPGGYDFARAAWFQGIGAYGFTLGPPTPAAEGGDAPDLWQGLELWVSALRHDASARIHAQLPGSTGAIAAALTVGDRSQIAAADDEAMRDSSLAHVLSISGLHMAIVGLGVFGTLRFLGALIPAVALRFQVKKWAAAAALLAAGAYLVLSGASVPAQRSFLMIGLVFVAVLLDRAPFTLRMVAISAFAVLAIAPESIVDPSFQMSFAAVTALVAAFEAFEAWQIRRGRPIVLRDSWTGRVLYALCIAVLSSAVAGLATAPYAAFHFNRIAAYGVLANVLAMPVIAFVIMPGAAISLVALPFGLEAVPLAVTGWGIDIMLWIAHATANLPGASSHVASWPDTALGAMTLGGLWLALWRGRWRLLGLAGIAVAFVIGAMAVPADILIDRDAKNVAVRAADGRLAILSGRRARFTSTEWLERDGDSREIKDSARAGRESVWTCTDRVCTAQVDGVTIGYLERAGDERAACGKGLALLIAARQIAPCPTGLTISAADTARDGAMALWSNGDGTFTIDTVRARIGGRPWTVWPKDERVP